MLYVYPGKDINDIYLSMLKNVLESNVIRNARGNPTKEIRPVITHLEKASSKRFLILPGRKLNYAFAIAEAIWILAGRGDNEFISTFNSNFSQFSDDGKTFHGSYGKRIRHANYLEDPEAFDRSLLSPLETKVLKENNDVPFNIEVDQIGKVVDKIRNDKDTRQAVITLWDPVKDNLFKAKDYPCNIACMFKQFNGEISINIARRSNDIIWGVPYNIVQFTTIQEQVADLLGCSVGDYTEDIDSLHIYTDLYNNLGKWIKIAVTDKYKKVANELTEYLYSDYKNSLFTWFFNIKLFELYSKKNMLNLALFKKLYEDIDLSDLNEDSKNGSYFILAFLASKTRNPELMQEAIELMYFSDLVTQPLFKYMFYEQFSAVRYEIRLEKFIDDKALCNELYKFYDEVV